MKEFMNIKTGQWYEGVLHRYLEILDQQNGCISPYDGRQRPRFYQQFQKNPNEIGSYILEIVNVIENDLWYQDYFRFRSNQLIPINEYKGEQQKPRKCSIDIVQQDIDLNHLKLIQECKTKLLEKDLNVVRGHYERYY